MARLLSRRWRSRLGKAFRRYFVNTVFDSTFVVMGIVVGSAIAPDAAVRTVVSTMFAASLALGISTGTSVYEAEKVESDIRLRDLEAAMLRELTDTEAERSLEVSRYLVVLVNVLAPLAVFALTATPFFLGSALSGVLPAAYVSIAIAIAILFAVGLHLGRLSGSHVLLKGLRMALIGLATFGAIWYLGTLFP